MQISGIIALPYEDYFFRINVSGNDLTLSLCIMLNFDWSQTTLLPSEDKIPQVLTNIAI